VYELSLLKGIRSKNPGVSPSRVAIVLPIDRAFVSPATHADDTDRIRSMWNFYTEYVCFIYDTPDYFAIALLMASTVNFARSSTIFLPISSVFVIGNKLTPLIVARLALVRSSMRMLFGS